MKASYIIGIGILLIVLVGGVLAAFQYFAVGRENRPLVPTAQKVADAVREALPDTTSEAAVPYRVETVAENLYVPWSIVFTSETRILVTERSGAVREIRNGSLNAKPLLTISGISEQSEEGLMGMTLHPDYETNKTVYLAYAYGKDDGLAVRVASYQDEGSELTSPKTIIDDLPAAQNHAGTRLRFGPDGKLYITTGDATDRQIAQQMESLGGKILRLNADGSIPSDNPFPNSPVYTLGHRNPQGIDWHPESGTMYETEHGPSLFDGPAGGDEVNVIVAGKNYGWPIVSHERNQDGLVTPVVLYTPAVAPASGMFYSGKLFPQFKHDFLFGGLRGEGIYRVQVDEANSARVVGYDKLEGVEVGRVRDIAEGPDGSIYFSTSNRDGRGNVNAGDDKLLRLVPQSP